MWLYYRFIVRNGKPAGLLHLTTFRRQWLQKQGVVELREISLSRRYHRTFCSEILASYANRRVSSCQYTLSVDLQTRRRRIFRENCDPTADRIWSVFAHLLSAPQPRAARSNRFAPQSGNKTDGRATQRVGRGHLSAASQPRQLSTGTSGGERRQGRHGTGVRSAIGRVLIFVPIARELRRRGRSRRRPSRSRGDEDTVRSWDHLELPCDPSSETLWR